ncbi:MAG: hypothetical protein J7578_07635, partial [Chitinophagaceae bacterium]|nr:hypothetical protein [Chitinophagaceae bacterium]
MAFMADKQTLEDLNILGKYKNNSLYSIFNQVKTSGGEQLLDDMFRHPLNDEQQINQRSSLFRYFQHKALPFPLEEKEFSDMQTYLNSGLEQGRFASLLHSIRRRSLNRMGLQERENPYEPGTRPHRG